MPTPPPLPRSMFVTVLAGVSLALGILGVVSGLIQGMTLAMMDWDPSTYLQMAGAATGETPVLPPAVAWMLTHLAELNLLSMLASAVAGVVSWGLLRRKEWGRIGFIALLLLSAGLGFAAAYAFGYTLDWAQQGIGADPALADPLLTQTWAMMKAALYISALAIAILHAAIAWKLHTPAIRAEFRRA